MDISYDGIGQTVATFNCAEDIAAGRPVKLSDNASVAECADGNAFNRSALHMRGIINGI